MHLPSGPGGLACRAGVRVRGGMGRAEGVLGSPAGGGRSTAGGESPTPPVAGDHATDPATAAEPTAPGAATGVGSTADSHPHSAATSSSRASRRPNGHAGPTTSGACEAEGGAPGAVPGEGGPAVDSATRCGARRAAGSRRRASAACAAKARARTESSAGRGAVGSSGRRARDRVRGSRRGARRAPRVRPQHARLPVRGVPQRSRGAEGAARTGRSGHEPAAAAGRRPPRARRLLDPRRPAARAPGDLSRRLHDGARDRRGAAARSGGGCPRLPGETDQPARGTREDQALGREVTSRQFLLIVAIAQGALLVALVILIILNRWVRVRRRAQIHPRRIELDGLMQRWSLGQAPSIEVLRALARLPAPVAIDALVTWSARIGGERWQELSRGLESQWWARAVRATSRSARWWKRLDCARFLSVAATSRDISPVLRLLHDHD